MSPSPATSSWRAGKSILWCFAKISHMSCKMIRFLQLQHPEKLYSSQQILGTCKLSIPQVLSRQHVLLCKFGAIWSSHVYWMFCRLPSKTSQSQLKEVVERLISDLGEWRSFCTFLEVFHNDQELNLSLSICRAWQLCRHYDRWGAY